MSARGAGHPHHYRDKHLPPLLGTPPPRVLPAITIKHRPCGQPMLMSFLVPAYLFVQTAEPLGRQCPSLPTLCSSCLFSDYCCWLFTHPCPSLSISVYPCRLLSSLCLLCLLPAHPHPAHHCSGLPITACSLLIFAHPCLFPLHSCFFPAHPWLFLVRCCPAHRFPTR